MKISPTLAGAALVLTIPKILPDAASYVGSAAYSTGEFLLTHAYHGTRAAAGYAYQGTVAAAGWTWENCGSPLADKGLEVIQDLAKPAMEFMSQPTSYSLLGRSLTYWNAAEGLVACVAIGVTLGLLSSTQPKPSKS